MNLKVTYYYWELTPLQRKMRIPRWPLLPIHDQDHIRLLFYFCFKNILEHHNRAFYFLVLAYAALHPSASPHQSFAHQESSLTYSLHIPFLKSYPWLRKCSCTAWRVIILYGYRNCVTYRSYQDWRCCCWLYETLVEVEKLWFIIF